MFVDIKLCIVLVGLCMVEICETNSYSDYLSNHYDNYAKKLSSYIRTVGDFVYTHPNDESPGKRLSPHTDHTYYEPVADDTQGFDSSSCYEELRKCWSTKTNDIPDDMMSRRIVNILLSRATVREEGSIVRRYIVLETSVAEEMTLKKFGLGELKLREIDPILNNGIKTPDGFYEYMTLIYAYISTFLNCLLDNKKIVIGILVLIPLGDTLYKTTLSYRWISFVGLEVLITYFLISSFKELEIVEKGKGTGSRDLRLPIQCQPDKMRWMDKAMTWFYHYDCESAPENTFTDEIRMAVDEAMVWNGKFLWWIYTSITDYLPQILLLIFALFILFLVLEYPITFLISLYGFLKKPRNIYAVIEKVRVTMFDIFFLPTLSRFKLLKKYLLKNLRIQATAAKYIKLNKLPATSNTKSGNKNEIPDNTSLYYKVYCGIERSVILKVKEEEESLEKSELEMKINKILGKSMEVDKILARIKRREGQHQITVAMKRKEDKEELIERWQELRDNGIFVEEDIILLSETARWIILGLTGKERVEEESRKICINEETWIWDDNTREWVESKVAEELESIQNSIKEVLS